MRPVARLGHRQGLSRGTDGFKLQMCETSYVSSEPSSQLASYEINRDEPSDGMNLLLRSFRRSARQAGGRLEPQDTYFDRHRAVR
jgi:hypothetical protein